MQDAKDSFYVTLRDRLVAINPARTIAIRGVTRPGLLVSENELATSFLAPDAFWMQWTDLTVDAQGSLPLTRMRCEFRYWTAGMTGNGGMDRGRMLAQMDAELAAMVRTEPQSVTKTSYVLANTPTRRTKVFWADVAFAAAIADGERMSRVATVEVFSYQEAGEL